MGRNWAWNLILIIVALIGTLNFMAQFFIKDYDPDPIITSAFMAIAGFLLTGRAFVNRFLDGRDEDKEDK
jgi:hypothetical protein